MKSRRRQMLLLLWTISIPAFAAGATPDKIDDHDKAIADASKAIRSNPKNSGAYVSRAAARLDKKQLERAISDASHAISLDPENAEAYHIRGVARFLKKQHVEAVHDLSEAIGLDQNISDAHYIRGLIRAKRGDFHKA